MDEIDHTDATLEEVAKNPTLEQKVRYPLAWVEQTQTSDDLLDLARDRLSDKVDARYESDPDDELVVVISDYGDCDGRSAAAVLTHLHGKENTVFVPAGHRDGSPDPIDALETVARSVPEDMASTVYFTDISPNKDEADTYYRLLGAVSENHALRVRDHHPWPDEPEWTTVVDDFKVHDTDGEDALCATEVVVREDYSEAPAHIQELARVTGVRDLWKDDHPDFDGLAADLADFAFEAEYGEYVEVVAEHGPNVMDVPEIAERIRANREEKQARIQYIAENANWHTVGGYEVALAYGSGYNSGIGQELQEQGADLVGIVTPTGKVSLRSNEETGLAGKVAEALPNGGGHAAAGGATPNWVNGDSEDLSAVPYRTHWRTAGKDARERLKSVVQEVVQEE